ncbi:hypothetical protein EVA_08777 [gut metagenome]|uniref:Uncharacterized protein n=1 Tax=gut metagenome TaxID=749906 RepID=J9CSE8_9ZZZZ
MEYYVQRRGNEALLAYSVMSACLVAVVGISLLTYHFGQKDEKIQNFVE